MTAEVQSYGLQSAIYVTGNKRKLVGDIIPYLNPTGERTHLVDVFTGSGCVILNTKHHDMFETYIGNDVSPQLVELHKMFQNKANFNVIKMLNEKYEHTKEAYLQLRADYNRAPCPEMLLLLNYRSNNNQLRWSKKTGFNVPYGERERYPEELMHRHHNLVRDNVTFTCKDFTQLCEGLLKHSDLNKTTVYLDPPYDSEVATAMYNSGWSWVDADNLRAYAVKLANKGAKVVYSNVFHNRGKENSSLIAWCKLHSDKFDVIHLNNDYSNSSFRKSDKKSDEVLVVSK